MRTLSPRARRRTIATASAVTLTALAFLPTAALAEGEPELLGDPVPYLIESRTAAGKVVEIGHPDAQLTIPGDTPAAAAVFPFAKTADELEEQAVLVYPVEGTEAVVLADDDGRVLVRRANDDADYRYLTIPGLTLDEAATDPAAQWNITDAGGGYSFVRGVQPYANGVIPGLDMYNWATASGSEVQTYDAGGADVQKWRMHAMVASVDVHEERVDSGEAPAFPSALTAKYSWGLTAPLTEITWDAPSADVWTVEGAVTVEGAGVGYFGETVPVTAEYLVGNVGGAVDATMTGYVGQPISQLRMHAPTTVERTIAGSEQTVTARVTWDWSVLADDATATEGVLEVPAAASTGFEARLLITLAPAETVNILRGDGIHYGYTHMNGSNFALTDGNRDVAGFDDWKSGGAANRVNPNTVSFYFDQPRQLTSVVVFDRNGRQNVGGVTVQYRDLIGGWVDLPARGVSWPYANTTPDLDVTFENDAVLATGMRVVITHKSDSTWMSLSEVEAYGPALAD